MRRLNKILEKKNSGKIVLGLFILTNIVYIIMLAFTIPKTMAFSNGMKLLDMMPTGYDYAYVNELFTSLGETGRNTYLTNQLPVDMIYPLLFGITYCLIMVYFLKKINKLHSPFIYLGGLPIVAGIADYFENIGIITMLNSYPDLTETTVSMTNIFSIIKSISTSVFFITLLVIALIVGVNFFKKSMSTT